MLHVKSFDKYLNICRGNKFEAVNLIASLARSLVIKYDNMILHSEALAWLLTGERPDVIDAQGKIKTVPSYRLSYMDDILSCVDDVDICEAVRYSIAKCNESNNLVYFYKNVPDDARQSRVRILVRMIWYNSHN